MYELQIFKNSEFGEVRTILKDGEPWMVGKDIANALGYSNVRDAILKHVDKEDKGVAFCDTLGGKQQMTIINESGLYALIFGSKLESAKRFKKWVTSEVLPAIRKTGAYKEMTPRQIMREQLAMIDEVNDRVTKLENNMTIDYGQQLTLGNLVSKQVIDALGGKESPAYKTVSKKVFSECNRDVKNYFHVNSRNNIAVIDFDKARDFIANWKPCYTTELLIRESNEL